jgi:hypothetical protein
MGLRAAECSAPTPPQGRPTPDGYAASACEEAQCAPARGTERQVLAEELDVQRGRVCPDQSRIRYFGLSLSIVPLQAPPSPGHVPSFAQ